MGATSSFSQGTSLLVLAGAVLVFDFLRWVVPKPLMTKVGVVKSAKKCSPILSRGI